MKETHNIPVRAQFHPIEDILIAMNVLLHLMNLLHIGLVVTTLTHAHAYRLGTCHARCGCCPFKLDRLSAIGIRRKKRFGQYRDIFRRRTIARDIDLLPIAHRGWSSHQSSWYGGAKRFDAYLMMTVIGSRRRHDTGESVLTWTVSNQDLRFWAHSATNPLHVR